MDSTLREIQLQSMKCHELLLQIESGQITPSLQNQITDGMNQLGRLVASLPSLLDREPSQKRELFQIKIQSATQNYHSLRISVEKNIDREHRKQLEERERQELFGERSDVVINVSGTPVLREREGLRRSNRKMDEMGLLGTSVLHSLSEQREQLKNTHRKMHDIFNTLGLSNSILRIADKKNYIDSWIVGVGILITLAVLFYVWYFYRV
eukprot:TRINITY_DN7440_c0_g1_i1.p1 TRINITY_DN7440_c0_g1~~TRINITY_DN7440_c0_g1_i1.p1  ORF type:complete len:209 (+),score=44.53 TRINITY_DN7440_c0_g1_i1:80-706(+)